MSEKSKHDKKADDLREKNDIASKTIYTVVAGIGREELTRPASGLFLSAVAAGFAISASPIMIAAISHALPDRSWTGFLAALGYPFGFLLIALARLQLFTETTLTAVIPVTRLRTRRSFQLLLRVWGIVLAGNVLGAVIIGLAMPILIGDALTHAMAEATHHLLDSSSLTLFLRAMPAGFLIGLMAWSLPTLSTDRFLSVFLITFLVGAAHFPHIIAGSVEMTVLVHEGYASLAQAIGQFWIPVLLGNTIGGAALFAGLAYGQVHKEVE